MVTQVRADDLTAIRGIGASRQRWLAQEFGVRTYVQLAALAPDEIEARLKSAGKLSSRAEIEGWVAQATQLAAATPPPSEREWTPAATFVVEFQRHAGSAAWRTVVHHLEADLGRRQRGQLGVGTYAELLRQPALPRRANAPNHGQIIVCSHLGDHRVLLRQPPIHSSRPGTGFRPRATATRLPTRTQGRAGRRSHQPANRRTRATGRTSGSGLRRRRRSAPGCPAYPARSGRRSASSAAPGGGCRPD